MTDFSFWDRIKTIFEMIFSSTFFISLFIVLILTIAILVLNHKIKTKTPKYLVILGYLCIIIFVLVKYGSYVLSINDSVVEKFFSAMYFPNLVVYLSMLLITLLLLAINFINEKFSLVTKICNVLCFGLIWFFFILVLDVMKSEGINVYEITEIYSNETLMILLQASMYVFFVWIGILLMNLAVRKISDKLDGVEKAKSLTTLTSDSVSGSTLASTPTPIPMTNNIPTNNQEDEIRDYTDEEFEIGYLNQQKLNKNEKIKEILNHRDIDY